MLGTDFDGSIIDLEEEKSRIFGEFLNQCWGVDADEAAKYRILTGGKSRRSQFDYFFNKQYGKVLTDDEYRKIEKMYSDKLKSELYPGATFVSGALELLEFSRKHFDKTFISSGVPDKEIKYLIKLKGIENYFDRVYGTDEKFRTKEDHFRALIAEYNPDLIVFVGDGLEDMRVGKRFNALTIGVPSHQIKEDLIEAGAQHVLQTHEIVGFLKTTIVK